MKQEERSFFPIPPEDMRNTLHRSVCLLTSVMGGQTFVSTISLISPNLALTAAANVYDRKNDRQCQSKDLFLYISDHGQIFRYEVEGFRYPSQFKTCLTKERRQHDYALLKLQYKIQYPQYLPLMNPCKKCLYKKITSLFGYPVESVKYEQSAKNKIRISSISQFGMTFQSGIELDQKTIKYKAKTKLGLMGGPVTEGNNIIGIHLGALSEDNKVARRIDSDAIGKLQQWRYELEGEPFLINQKSCDHDINESENDNITPENGRLPQYWERQIYTIKKINLLIQKGNKWESVQILMLNGSLKDLKLKRLQLYGVNTPDNILQQLCLIFLPNLTKINLENNGLSIIGIYHLLTDRWNIDATFELFHVNYQPGEDNKGYHLHVGSLLPKMRQIYKVMEIQGKSINETGIYSDLTEYIRAIKLLLEVLFAGQDIQQIKEISEYLQKKYLEASEQRKDPKSAIMLKLQQICGKQTLFSQTNNIKTKLSSFLLLNDLLAKRITIKIQNMLQKYTNFSDLKDVKKYYEQSVKYLKSCKQKSVKHKMGIPYHKQKIIIEKFEKGSIHTIFSMDFQQKDEQSQPNILQAHHYQLQQYILQYQNVHGLFENDNIIAQQYFQYLQICEEIFKINRPSKIYQRPAQGQIIPIKIVGGLPLFEPVAGTSYEINDQGLYTNDQNQNWWRLNSPQSWGFSLHGIRFPNKPLLNRARTVIQNILRRGTEPDFTMLRNGDYQNPQSRCLIRDKPVGRGVYSSPYFLHSLNYANYGNQTCCVILKCRIDPKKVSILRDSPIDWVINRKYIRPCEMIIVTQRQKQELFNNQALEQAHMRFYGNIFSIQTWKTEYRQAFIDRVGQDPAII